MPMPKRKGVYASPTGYNKARRAGTAAAGSVAAYTLKASKGVRSKRRVTGVSGTVRAAVKKLIENQKEQKISVDMSGSGVPTVMVNTDTITPAPPAWFAVLPYLNNGNAENQRVGNRINMSALHLKYQISIQQGVANDNGPYICTVWVARARKAPVSAPTNVLWQELLMGAGGVASSVITDQPGSQMLPVNEDVWQVVHRKEYKMGKADSANLVNNDFSACIQDEVNLLPFVKKSLYYDGSLTAPQNDGLYLFYTFCSVDSGSTTAAKPSYVHTITSRYTDA